MTGGMSFLTSVLESVLGSDSVLEASFVVVLPAVSVATSRGAS